MEKRCVNMFYIFFVLILIMGLGISGCSSDNTPGIAPPTGNTPDVPRENTGTPPATSTVVKSVSDMFKYGLVKDYSYRTNTKVGEAWIYSDQSYAVQADNLDSKPVWLSVINTETQVGKITTKVWLDRSTNACLKYESYIEANGQKIPQAGNCPATGPTAVTLQNSELKNLGTDPVSVPAGSFDAVKYEINGVSYWIAPNVPVPVKITYDSDSVKMVLTAYS
jgi:hypothetical protein